MTIEINDVRSSKKGVLWDDLQTGVVYIYILIVVGYMLWLLMRIL